MIKRARAQAALRQSEERVQQQFRELQGLHKILRDTDRRKDEFLALLGHELRNPLGIISTAIQLLQIRGPADKKLAELRDMIESQVKDMRRMIDDLLDISRISTGKIHLEKQRCDLTEIVLNATIAYRPAIEAAGLELAIERPDHPLWIDCDRTRVTQMLGNLLHNAGKFTGAGGTVVMKLAPTPDGIHAIISVKDNGIGIEPEALTRIFDIFSQADNAVGRSHEGLGLGLALVKGLVELHGGEITAASDGIGCGAEFTIRLPLADSLVAAKPVERRSRSEVRPYRILLIEDNPMAALSMQMFLRETGHQVEVADSGLAGILQAEQLRPEIVLCDIALPDIDGYEVASRLRHHYDLNGICLIAITGYGQDQDKVRALAAGFDAHLAKPVDFQQLQLLLADRDRQQPGPLMKGQRH